MVALRSIAVLSLVLVAGAPLARAQEESAPPPPIERWKLPDWIPSTSFGIGATMRTVDGSLVTQFPPNMGIRTSATVSDSGRFFCRAKAGYPGECFTRANKRRSVNSIAVPIGVQLLGPPLESVPGAPRPLLAGAVALPISERLVAWQGFKPEDFDSNGRDPDVRLELRQKIDTTWWAGIGGAVELPLDLAEHQRVWLKLTVNYFEERTTLTGRVDQFVAVGDIRKVTQSTDVVIRGVGPGVGVEALVWKWGPLSIGVGADFLASFPLSGTDAALSVVAPGFGNRTQPPNGGKIDFAYSADAPNYQAYATFRFSWTGK